MITDGFRITAGFLEASETQHSAVKIKVRYRRIQMFTELGDEVQVACRVTCSVLHVHYIGVVSFKFSTEGSVGSTSLQRNLRFEVHYKRRWF